MKDVLGSMAIHVMTLWRKEKSVSGHELGSKPTLRSESSAATNESDTSSSETPMGMRSGSKIMRAVEDRAGLDITSACVQEYVHTPIGLRGMTAWNTVVVGFEPARPNSPPPAWPISGESNHTRRLTTSKLLCANPCVPIVCGFLGACNHCRDCSGSSPDDFRVLSRRSRRGPLASSLLM